MSQSITNRFDGEKCTTKVDFDQCSTPTIFTMVARVSQHQQSRRLGATCELRAETTAQPVCCCIYCRDRSQFQQSNGIPMVLATTAPYVYLLGSEQDILHTQPWVPCFFYFYRAASNASADQRRESCPSVRLTNAWWIVTKRKKICPDFNNIRKIIQPSFLRRRTVDGGNPFYVKFWVKLAPLERNRRFSVDIRSQRLSGSIQQKVQLTLIESPLRDFQ